MDEYLKQIKEEIEKVKSSSGWHQLYQRIKAESPSDYTCHEARNPINKLLNRYRDVSPFDHSRVVLKNGPCNYINASLVKVEKAGRNYILTQGPLPHTAGHFWLMVKEQNSKAILMLNKIIEKNQIKCHQYWPVGTKDSDVMEFSDVNLRVRLLSENETHKNFIIRNLRIEEISTGNSRDVLQFHYVTWPDFGTPSTPRSFLHFLQEVRDSGALNSDCGPAVVHCSAGIGRSGTFCLVDSLILMMENGQKVDVKEVLLEMRKYRMGLIQTADQLQFSYLAIQEGLQQYVDGKTRFMPDDEENGLISNGDDKPQPPKRIDSLSPSREDFENIIKLHVMENPYIQRPLPDLPSPDDESSDDDILADNVDESDSETDDSDDDDDEEIGDTRIDEESPSSEPLLNKDSAEPIEPDEGSHVDKFEDTNGHAKPNGLDESTLRRRTKNEATLEKIREIKQKQKEQEMKSEIYHAVYRSLTGKPFIFCCLGVLGALYFYSKL